MDLNEYDILFDGGAITEEERNSIINMHGPGNVNRLAQQFDSSKIFGKPPIAPSFPSWRAPPPPPIAPPAPPAPAPPALRAPPAPPAPAWGAPPAPPAWRPPVPAWKAPEPAASPPSYVAPTPTYAYTYSSPIIYDYSPALYRRLYNWGLGLLPSYLSYSERAEIENMLESVIKKELEKKKDEADVEKKIKSLLTKYDSPKHKRVSAKRKSPKRKRSPAKHRQTAKSKSPKKATKKSSTKKRTTKK